MPVKLFNPVLKVTVVWKVTVARSVAVVRLDSGFIAPEVREIVGLLMLLSGIDLRVEIAPQASLETFQSFASRRRSPTHLVGDFGTIEPIQQTTVENALVLGGHLRDHVFKVLQNELVFHDALSVAGNQPEFRPEVFRNVSRRNSDLANRSIML
jgi:hypothetical protein